MPLGARRTIPNFDKKLGIEILWVNYIITERESE